MRQFISNQRGVASIEFSLSIIIFITLILFFAEMMYMTYISSALDLAISEAAKKEKNSAVKTAEQYQSEFKNTLSNSQKLLWSFIHTPEIEVEIGYCNSIEELKKGCRGIQAKDNRIARYKFSYNYQPLFFPHSTYWTNRKTIREVVFVQESQNMPHYR